MGKAAESTIAYPKASGGDNMPGGLFYGSETEAATPFLPPLPFRPVSGLFPRQEAGMSAVDYTLGKRNRPMCDAEDDFLAEYTDEPETGSRVCCLPGAGGRGPSGLSAIPRALSPLPQ